MKWLLVFVGGGLGAALRVALATWVDQRLGPPCPWGTIAVNVSGCFAVGEVSCPAAYFEEASSINFRRSLRYGLGVVNTSLQAFLHRKGIASARIFDPQGRGLLPVSGAPASKPAER